MYNCKSPPFPFASMISYNDIAMIELNETTYVFSSIRLTDDIRSEGPKTLHFGGK
jgi:hypothetical protein